MSEWLIAAFLLLTAEIICVFFPFRPPVSLICRRVASARNGSPADHEMNIFEGPLCLNVFSFSSDLVRAAERHGGALWSSHFSQ